MSNENDVYDVIMAIFKDDNYKAEDISYALLRVTSRLGVMALDQEEEQGRTVDHVQLTSFTTDKGKSYSLVIVRGE